MTDRVMAADKQRGLAKIREAKAQVAFAVAVMVIEPAGTPLPVLGSTKVFQSSEKVLQIDRRVFHHAELVLTGT
jgi:hypothetical protein